MGTNMAGNPKISAKEHARFYNITELSEYLGVKVNTLYSWISEKRIPYIKVGRLVRFDKNKIEEWLATHSFEVV